MENTNIGWTKHSHNFWIGCVKKTDACRFCYAEEFMGKKTGRFGVLWGKNADRHRTKTWNDPIKWNKKAALSGIRERVFSSSLSDFFEDNTKVEAWRKDAWKIIKDTLNLDWMLLTKRPECVSGFLPDNWGNGYDNVWIGTSIGSDNDLHMITDLALIENVKVKFLSCEPLIGPLDLSGHLVDSSNGVLVNPINLVIVGGESGSNARPCNYEWIDKVVDDCRKAGVPVFVKQLGSNYFVDGVKVNHKKGEDINEFPEKFKIRDNFTYL